jgi:hypothetical protein
MQDNPIQIFKEGIYYLRVPLYNLDLPGRHCAADAERPQRPTVLYLQFRNPQIKIEAFANV